MAKSKTKCVRGTSRTIVASLLTPEARQYIAAKGGKGAKALLKKHLALKLCKSESGAMVVRKATLTDAKLTPGGVPKAKRRSSRKSGWSEKGRRLYRQSGSDYVPMRTAMMPQPPPPYELPPFMDGL